MLSCVGCEGILGKAGPEADETGDGDATLYPDGDAPDDATCEEVGSNVGANVLRRLTRVEYQLTVQDLFQLPSPSPVALVPEDVEKEGFTSFSEVQQIEVGHIRAYLDTAAELFSDLVTDSARLSSVVGCEPGEANCLADFVSRFGRLAYRRALTTEESSALVAAASASATDATEQIGFAVEALLASPHFLFRVEVGDSPEGLSNLEPLELASKLSFTLWGRAPSAALLDRADAGELDTAEGLRTIALEMLGDERAQEYFGSFFQQWLGYSKLRAPIEPPADWSDALMGDMVAETDTLLAEFAWTPGQDLFASLTANHTTVSPALASFYGITAYASGMYTFSGDEPRADAGILGHASLLSQKSDGDKISVRGNWVRKTFLCEELEIPQAIADSLGEELVGLTSIQIIEKRNTQSQCAGCHSIIDPIGVGLAQFDTTGRFDETVDLAEYPIAPGFPEAPEPNFASLGELAQKVQAMPELAECLTERVFVYTQGRHATGSDACTTEGATDTFSGSGNGFAKMLEGLILTDTFRLRRAPSPTGGN